MKKVLFLGAFAVLGLASCKKDYTCECSTTAGGQTISQSTTINGTKKDAKDACEGGSSSANGITVTCVIK